MQVRRGSRQLPCVRRSTARTLRNTKPTRKPWSLLAIIVSSDDRFAATLPMSSVSSVSSDLSQIPPSSLAARRPPAASDKCYVQNRDRPGGGPAQRRRKMPRVHVFRSSTDPNLYGYTAERS